MIFEKYMVFSNASLRFAAQGLTLSKPFLSWQLGNFSIISVTGKLWVEKFKERMKKFTAHTGMISKSKSKMALPLIRGGKPLFCQIMNLMVSMN
jgi:hypothetical protein